MTWLKQLKHNCRIIGAWGGGGGGGEALQTVSSEVWLCEVTSCVGDASGLYKPWELTVCQSSICRQQENRRPPHCPRERRCEYYWPPEKLTLKLAASLIESCVCKVHVFALQLKEFMSLQMMLKTQRSQQRVALMILMVVAAVQCQENERYVYLSIYLSSKIWPEVKNK